MSSSKKLNFDGNRREFGRFRELLKSGMGDMSVRELSNKSGISYSHLSRMLSSTYISRPSIKSLSKLASVLDGVSLEDLLEACGYHDEAAVMGKSDSELSERQKRMKMPVSERVRMHVSDLKAGFGALCGKPLKKGAGISGLIDMVDAVYVCEDASYDVRKDEPLPSPLGTAEGIAVIDASTTIGGFKSTTTFAVLYFMTSGGRLVPTECVFGFEDLVEYGAVPEALLSEFARYGISPLQDDVTVTVRKTEQDRQKEVCEKIVEAILGEGARKHAATFTGIGFYLDEVPPNFKEFLAGHRDTLCKDLGLAEMYGRFTGGASPEDAFSGFSDSDTWGAVVSEVMRAETGISFEFFRKKEGEGLAYPRSCVMVPEDSMPDGSSADALLQIAYKYGKELGLKEVGECYYETVIQEDNNSFITIEY